MLDVFIEDAKTEAIRAMHAHDTRSDVGPLTYLACAALGYWLFSWSGVLVGLFIAALIRDASIAREDAVRERVGRAAFEHALRMRAAGLDDESDP